MIINNFRLFSNFISVRAGSLKAGSVRAGSVREGSVTVSPVRVSSDTNNNVTHCVVLKPYKLYIICISLPYRLHQVIPQQIVLLFIVSECYR